MPVTRIVIDRRRLVDGTPAIVTITPEGYEYSDEVIIRDAQGTEVAKVTGSAMGRNQVSGARVWIETENTVDLILTRSK